MAKIMAMRKPWRRRIFDAPWVWELNYRVMREHGVGVVRAAILALRNTWRMTV